jgi:hypothetical protein
MSDESRPESRREAAAEEAPAPDQRERPLFVHPRWTVGVVLIFGVAAIVAGLRDPVWFLIGAPCILVLIVYVWVRVLGAGRP